MIKRPYKRKSQIADTNTFMQTPYKSDDRDSRVTGISRSGRVRKKSSKLIDYEESGEDQDKSKRRSEAAGCSNTSRGGVNKVRVQNVYEHDYITNDASVENSNSTQNFSDSESEPNAFGSNDDFIDSSDDSSGTEFHDEIMDDRSDDDIDEIPYNRSSIGSNSSNQKLLYMNEKSSKSKNKKSSTGRIKKAQRKDKGKARYSAYMIWAKEVRPQLMKNNPNTDYSNLSSKLSEMWATLRPNDKYMWKQKAKRMSMLARNNDSKEESNIQKTQRKKYINQKVPTADHSKSPEKHSSVVDNKSNTIGLPNTDVLDVSAHLNLLGESLSTIGQRLKQHEGQIAVSGSLSVLLDSLLCSVSPLLCLTQQVEEMNGCSPETLSSILDNIAYIMPGL